jgi:hypothetical protein
MDYTCSGNTAQTTDYSTCADSKLMLHAGGGDTSAPSVAPAVVPSAPSTTGGWAVFGIDNDATCGFGSSLRYASGDRLDNCKFDGMSYYIMFTCVNGKRKPILQIPSFLLSTQIIFLFCSVGTPKTGYYNDAGCTILSNQYNYRGFSSDACTPLTGSSGGYAKSFCSPSPVTGFASNVDVLM